jgi:hypothetical protein
MKKEKAAQPVAEVTTPAAPDPINRIPEAARILGCNEQTLADKLRKGEIKAKSALATGSPRTVIYWPT